MLPGLRPSHTRASFSSGSRLYVELHAPTPEDYIQLERGLWLLPAVIAERDRRKGEEKLSALAERQRAEEMKKVADRTTKAARILGRTSITETGCMVDGLRGGQDPFEWALKLADAEWGSYILTTEEDMPHIQACDTEGCYNSRHFEIDFGKPTLYQRQHELNPNWFVTQEDDTITTVWGDKLPSLKESLEYYIKFQRKNFPFVPIDKSKLTAGPVSQVVLHPVSGCWESWRYYSKRAGDTTRNGRFDGYGTMYQKYRVTNVDPDTGEIIHSQRRGSQIAHRLLWRLSGRRLDPEKVLNHLCNYKRCCNPLHLRQVTVAENNIHGIKVSASTNALTMLDPDIEDAYLSAEEMVPYRQTALELYRNIAETNYR